MKTLLFVLLVTALSVQDDVAERVQLSKIKDVEKAKSNIKRVTDFDLALGTPQRNDSSARRAAAS